MKITIGQNVESKTSAAGKEYKKFGCKREDGQIFQNVVAFPFYTQFTNIVSGAVLEGIIKEEDYNGQKSYKLQDGNLGPKPNSFGGGAANMAKKAETIAKAQDRKEEGVMVSSTARMATEAALAFKTDTTSPEQFKVSWQIWREWFVKNWDNTNAVGVTSAGTKVPDFSEVSNDINPEDIPF